MSEKGYSAVPPKAENNERKFSLPFVDKFKKWCLRAMVGLSIPFVFGATAAFADNPNDRNENNPDEFAEVVANPNDEDVEDGIQHLQDVMGESDDSTPVAIVFGDSVGVEVAPISNTIEFMNWSEQSTSFGYYPDSTREGHGEFLDRIRSMSDKPEYVMFMFGRNDANRINVSTAWDILNADYNNSTGRVDNNSYEGQWLNEIFSLIDDLEAEEVGVIFIAPTEIASNNESPLMNNIFRRIASTKHLAYIDPSSGARESAREYGFTYGSSILTTSQQIDGVHFDPDVYPELNRLIAGSVEDIEALRRQSGNNSNRENRGNRGDVSMSDAMRDRIRGGILGDIGGNRSPEQDIRDRLNDRRNNGNRPRINN